MPPTSLGQSPLRPTPVSSLTALTGGPGMQSTVDAMSTGGSIYLGTSGPPNSQQQQPLPMIKPQKKRKDGVNDYESTTSASNRDDVQSPAYSDISDDSTPVVDSDMIGKFKESCV